MTSHNFLLKHIDAEHTQAYLHHCILAKDAMLRGCILKTAMWHSSEVVQDSLPLSDACYMCNPWTRWQTQAAAALSMQPCRAWRSQLTAQTWRD